MVSVLFELSAAARPGLPWITHGTARLVCLPSPTLRRIDFKIKATKIMGKQVKLQIWDTAGQERFRNITSGEGRASRASLLV